MARNSGNGNSGCLMAILFVIFFAGNVFLFSGSLGNDLEGNPIAIIMVLGAVIADIAIIYWIIKSIAKRIEHDRQRKLHAKADAVKTEINRIISLYRFPDVLVMGASSQEDGLKVERYNEDILQLVKQYREETKGMKNDLAELSRQNSVILSCPNCYSDEQKLLFLQKETVQLEDLKRTITDSVAKSAEYRIVLPDANEIPLITLKNALKEIQNSRKIKQDGAISLIEFLECSKLPTELYCFKCNALQIILTFKPLTFCLLPKVILVFTGDAFLSAIQPSELKISVTPIETTAVFSNSKYGDNIVDMDSKCVQVGSSRKTWMHVRKDGTPDLRYSYNPLTEYRVDHMIYGKAVFEIAGFSAAFSFSSYKALEMLEKAAQLYCISDESALPDQRLEPPEQVGFHQDEVIEPVCSSKYLIVKDKKYFGSDYLKTTVAEFDALFSKCLTHQDIIKEYIASIDSEELIKSTKIEILRFYLQHYSRFQSFNWTKEYIQELLSEQIKISGNRYRRNSDESHIEKQYTSQMSALISVLAAVLTSKINVHEHTGTFVAFHITEDEDVAASVYAPQKINYQSFAIKEPIGEDPYRRFKKMRAVKAHQDTGLSFVAQARYMETFEDTYESHENFEGYYPTYMDMNDKQLRTYFTWRTKVRDGQVEATDLSYAFVYIYELLNLIGAASAEEGMRQLLTFWSNYRSYDDKIDQYVERWVKEFYVYYRLSCSYKSILDQFPDGIIKESSKQEEIFLHNYKNKDVYLNQLSSHKYLQSKFYESELGYTLIECIPLVLARVDSYLGERGISFPTLLLGNVTTNSWWHPFNGAVVNVKNPSDSYSVKISAVEEFSFENGKWQSKQLQRRYNSNLLGYIIKTTETELRELTGYKRKLQPNIGSITYDGIQNKKALKVINDPEFTDVILSVVMAYFANSGIRPQAFKIVVQDAEMPIKPVEVKIDLSKLEAIRSAAAEVQDRLVIDDSEEGPSRVETDVLIEETNVTANCTKAGKAEVTSAEMQERTLSKSQRICISIIISGQNVNSRIAEWSIANGTLPEVLIEGINELLFEAFEDNVIDAAADVPYIYDDYLDDVKKLIEED